MSRFKIIKTTIIVRRLANILNLLVFYQDRLGHSNQFIIIMKKIQKVYNRKIKKIVNTQRR